MPARDTNRGDYTDTDGREWSLPSSRPWMPSSYRMRFNGLVPYSGLAGHGIFLMRFYTRAMSPDVLLVVALTDDPAAPEGSEGVAEANVAAIVDKALEIGRGMRAQLRPDTIFGFWPGGGEFGLAIRFLGDESQQWMDCYPSALAKAMGRPDLFSRLTGSETCNQQAHAVARQSFSQSRRRLLG